MSRTIRYTVYLEVSDEDYDSYTWGWMDGHHDAFKSIPGFIESSFEDSYSN